MSCADEVFGQFLAANADAGCSLVLFDSSGVVRARRDADAALARLLDGLLLVPGYGYAERTVGSTAASIALHERTDFALSGAEHYHAQLMCVAEAAALLPDPHGGEPAGVVAVICHDSDRTALQLPLARLLAGRVADRMAGEPHRRAQAILQHFGHRDGHDGEWALATDGDFVLSNGVARRLDPADQRALADLALSGLVLHDFGYRHLDLPDRRLRGGGAGGGAPGRGADRLRAHRRPVRRPWPPRVARVGPPAGLARRPADPPRLRSGPADRPAPRTSTPRPGCGPTGSCSRRSCGPGRRWWPASGRAATTC